MEHQGLPRLFTIEDEYVEMLHEAELEWVERLVKEIEGGSLEGIEQWRAWHEALATGTARRPWRRTRPRTGTTAGRHGEERHDPTSRPRASPSATARAQALDGLDLVGRAGPGASPCSGPNGAGKTTFVRAVATLLRPDAARCASPGIDVRREPARSAG